jgi:hypothetical protein
MVQLQLTDDEAGILLSLIESYMPELEVEIHRGKVGLYGVVRVDTGNRNYERRLSEW